jgi:hypothetical protein
MSNSRAAKSQINREASPIPLDTFFEWFQESHNFYTSNSTPLNNSNHDGRLGNASLVMPDSNTYLGSPSNHKIQPDLDSSISKSLESKSIRRTERLGNNARNGNRSLEMIQVEEEVSKSKYPNSQLRKQKGNGFIKAHEDITNFKLEEKIINYQVQKYNELDLLHSYATDSIGAYDFIQSDVITTNIKHILKTKEMIIEDAKDQISNDEIKAAQVNVSKYNQLLPAIEHTINNLSDFNENNYHAKVNSDHNFNTLQKDHLNDVPGIISECINMLRSPNGIFSNDSMYHPLLFRSFFSRMFKPTTKLKQRNKKTSLADLVLNPPDDLTYDFPTLTYLQDKISHETGNHSINQFLCGFLIARRYKAFQSNFDPEATLEDILRRLYSEDFSPQFLLIKHQLGDTLKLTYSKFMYDFGFSFFSRRSFFRLIYFLDNVFVQNYTSRIDVNS